MLTQSSTEVQVNHPLDELEQRIRTNFPQEIINKHIWMPWKKEIVEDAEGNIKVRKPPCDFRGWKTNHMTNKMPLARALDVARKYDLGGVGITLSGSGLVGIDKDACIDDGIINKWIYKHICNLNSYSEVSYSGTGTHTLVWGTITKQIHKNAEVYDNQFFVVTGNHIAGTPLTINSNQSAIDMLVEDILKGDVQNKPIEASPLSQKVSKPTPSKPTSIDDEQLLEKMFSNQKKGEKIKALWKGDTSGYESESNADAALCNELAFWTGNDVARIDRLFRLSGLMRLEKWDRAAGQGKTYGQKTISFALANNTYESTKKLGSEPNIPDPKFLSTIQSLRTFVKEAYFSDYISSSTSIYKTSGTDKKVADAILDMFEQTGKFRAALSMPELLEKTGEQYKQVIYDSLARLEDWFIHKTDKKNSNSVPYYILLLDIIDAPPAPVYDDGYDLGDTKNSSRFSEYKAHDAFASGCSEYAKRHNLNESSFDTNDLLVMDALDEHGPMTRVKISKIRGLKKKSIEKSCEKLSRFGLIHQEREAPRKPYLVSLSATAWTDILLYSKSMKTYKIGIERRDCRLIKKAMWIAEKCEKEVFTKEAVELRLKEIRDQRIAINRKLYKGIKSNQEIIELVNSTMPDLIAMERRIKNGLRDQYAFCLLWSKDKNSPLYNKFPYSEDEYIERRMKGG